MLIFCEKSADISKIKGLLVRKGIIDATTYVYLRANEYLRMFPA